MASDPDASGGWRFAQCFGDKGDVKEITEGMFFSTFAISTSPRTCDIAVVFGSCLN